MNKCENYKLKKKCKKEICCFDCRDKCPYTPDKCFDQKVYRNFILRGYPEKCLFFIKEEE